MSHDRQQPSQHGAEIDTWRDRDLPLLRVAVRAAELGAIPEFEQLEAETGVTEQQVRIGVRALHDGGYVKAYFDGGMSGGRILDVTERGRRATGAWPSAAAITEDLARALADAAEHEPDAGRKSWLKSVATGMAGVGQSLFTAELEGILRRYGLLP